MTQQLIQTWIPQFYPLQESQLQIKQLDRVKLECNELSLPWSYWHAYVSSSEHFSHPFLGTYEVHQFLDLGYLEGTHSGVVYELHTNTMLPWNGKPIPYPTHSNTMSLTIPSHLIPYHLTSYHTIRGVWGPFYQIWKVFLQAAILVHWAPSFVDRFFRFLLSF